MDKNSKPAADARSAAEGLWKTFAASTAAMVMGLAFLLQATALGNAFTTETLRRTEVAEAPTLVADLAVYDAAGHSSSLRQLLAGGERVWIVGADFEMSRRADNPVSHLEGSHS